MKGTAVRREQSKGVEDENNKAERICVRVDWVVEVEFIGWPEEAVKA